MRRADSKIELRSFLLAILFVITCFVFFTLNYFFKLIHKPETVNALLAKDRLYELSVASVVIELSNEDFILAFKNSPLEISQDDLRMIIKDNFSEPFVSEKAVEVHSGLLAYLHDFPADTIFFSVSIKKEKPILFSYLPTLLEKKLSVLPECSDFQLIEIGWKVLTLAMNKKSIQNSFFQSLPRCRPPASAFKSFSNLIDKYYDQLIHAIPDSVRAFPSSKTRDLSGYTGMLKTIKSVDSLFFHFAGFFHFALVLLVALMIVSHRKNLAAAFLQTGLSLSFAGLLMLAVHLPTYFNAESLNVFGVFVQDRVVDLAPNTRSWLDLTFYVLNKAVKETSYNVNRTAGLMLIIGVVLTLQYPIAQRLKNRNDNQKSSH